MSDFKVREDWMAFCLPDVSDAEVQSISDAVRSGWWAKGPRTIAFEKQFAEYVGGKDDVWYATNIEIYDYVKAYESLQTSVDKKIIHNPTNIDVWAEEKGEILHIKAGETLYR